jgi:phosphohistidine phosphatase
MRLILVRHAEAATLDSRQHQHDGQRELTPRGRVIHARMAAALAHVEPRAQRILTSPMVRTRETAEITADALGIPPGEIRACDALGDGFSKKGVLTELKRFPEESVVVVVGHAPTLGDLAADWLHRGGGVAIEFKKRAMLCLDFEGYPEAGGAELLWLLTPKSLPRESA